MSGFVRRTGEAARNRIRYGRRQFADVLYRESVYLSLNPDPINAPAAVTSSRELGLDLAAIAARYLFGTDHLHYGLWTEGLPVHMNNLLKAQEQYADMLLATIPEGTKTILDVGTGTGILAIAAAKVDSKFQTSNSKFVGCDTDANSIKIAEENAALNEVEGIDFYVGSISDETQEADFVCANILPDVIIPILPLLLEKSKRFLVLSGILKEQEKSVADKLRNLQISDFKIETDGEWISVTIPR